MIWSSLQGGSYIQGLPDIHIIGKVVVHVFGRLVVDDPEAWTCSGERGELLCNLRKTERLQNTSLSASTLNNRKGKGYRVRSQISAHTQ